jgi:MEMO1 family protein
MRAERIPVLALLFTGLAVLLPVTAVPQAAPGVREPAVAGQFYPAAGPRLSAAIDAFLREAVPPRPERPLAILVPHAGYVYSGQIAADAFRQAGQYRYRTVVILGPNHSGSGAGRIAIAPGTAFRTPLGLASIDERFRADLMKEDPDCVVDAMAHASEHSIEVQVPFVQRVFPGAAIVPIVVGDVGPEAAIRLGRALGRIARDREALIVASSDLSHYPSLSGAREVDRQVLVAVASLDVSRLAATTAEQMKRGVPGLATCACGENAIAAAMTAAVALGATRATVVSYANSGETLLGESSKVVGYGAVVMTAGERASELNTPGAVRTVEAGVPLESGDRDALLAIARAAIQRYLATDTVPLVRSENPRLQRSNGVFVTLRKRGDLRGCIGRLVPDAPLATLTGRMALESAFQDPRFDAVRADELNEITIEVSVLTTPRPVADAAAIVVGRDGVILEKLGRSAVFLPSVATEQGWTREQLLDNLSLKAGLPAASWRSGARLFVFQAEVFSEKKAQ